MPAPAKDDAETAAGKLSDLLWKAIPAIGSAIGFASFIAAIGAALLWLRFDAVGLPATQALAAVPREELLITGAWALAIFVLGGLIASLLVYLFDSRGDANVSTARGIAIVATLEMYATLYILDLNTLEIVLFLVTATGLGIVGMIVLSAYTTHFTRRRKLKQLRREILLARDQLVTAIDAAEAAEEVQPQTDDAAKATGEARLELATARHRWSRAITEWARASEDLVWPSRRSQVKASRLKVTRLLEKNKTPPSELALRPMLDNTEKAMGGAYFALWRWLREMPGQIEGHWRRRRSPLSKDLAIAVSVLVVAGLTVLVVLVVVGIVLLLGCHGLLADGAWIAVLVAVAVLLAVTNLFIAHGTERFLWYGVAVFFSVVVFGSVLEIANTLAHPEVQPVAIVRKDNTVGLCGVFVAQTNDRVYVGRLPFSELLGKEPRPGQRFRPGLIFWVPTSDVELVSVGRSVPTKETRQRASVLLERLYRDRAEEEPAILKNRTVTVTAPLKGAPAGDQKTVVTETRPKKYSSSPRQRMTVDTNCDSALDPPSKPSQKPTPAHKGNG